MLARLLRFFGPPPGARDAGRVREFLLSRGLNVYIGATLGIVVFYPSETASGKAVIALAASTTLMAVLLRGLLHRGAARLASWIFLVVLSLIVPAVSLYLAGTVALMTVAIFQMMLIVLAGLLLGGREAIGFALATVAGNGVLFWQEAMRTPPRADALQAAWILQAIFYSATGALLAKAITLTEEALALASREMAERRAAEAALREGLERYRLITTVSSDYAFSTELGASAGLRLNWVAGAFERITGFTFEEYVARGGWRAALHPDDVAQDTHDLQTLQQNRPIASELRTICRDGSVRWVRISAHPVWDDAHNRLSGIHGAVQDISERKAAEGDREALIRELEARNAELERFTYTVSHDLKSPLITVRAFLGHIEEAAVEGRIDAVRADMDRVHRAAAKMHELLDDLLELSRAGRQAKPPAEVPFETIVRDALDRAQGRLAAHGVLVDVEAPLPNVRVDRDRMVEVLQNLIDNAAKFMGEQPEPRIVIGVRDTDAERAFFVCDNGVGIPAQYRDRVFNLFDKLDPRSSGTGIGLAIVKRIIEVHGGRIWVEPRASGVGSAFLFTLGGHGPEPTALRSRASVGHT